MQEMESILGSKSNSVAAVVVTYNRKKLLLECVQALIKQSASEVLDILVIDNASTDGTAAALEPYVKTGHVIHINTGSNLGGAGGFQFGIREATMRGYDYIWIMDDDCIPQTGALAALISWSEKLGTYGFLSSKALWKDGTVCEMNIQRHSIAQRVSDFSIEPNPIQIATFVSLFIPTKVVLELGLPIKEFFIWTDDWEYTRRISRSYPCYLIPSSVVKHLSAENRGSDIAAESNPDRFERYRLMYRNSVYLYRREGVYGWLYCFARVFGHAFKVILKAENNKAMRLHAIFGGTKDGFSFNPQIAYVKDNKSRESI